MKLIQKRRYFNHGTFSEVFTENGELLCVLVERPDLNNKQNESCIPEGKYTLSPYTSPNHGQCFILEAKELGVYKFPSAKALRTGILWHVGNTTKDVIGCAAVGQRFGVLNDWGVTSSRLALDHLVEIIKTPIELRIEKA